MRVFMEQDATSSIVDAARKSLKDNELDILRPQLSIIRHSYQSNSELLRGLEKIISLINSEQETYQINKAYRLIQKQLRKYTGDKSYYPQYFSFDYRKERFPADKAKLEAIADKLREEIAALKRQYQQVYAEIQKTEKHTHAPNDITLLRVCYQVVTSNIKEQITEQSKQQLVHLSPLFISKIMFALHQETKSLAHLATKKENPIGYMLDELTASANQLLSDNEARYKYLDKCLFEIYNVKKVLIDKRQVQSNKFGLAEAIETKIMEMSTSASQKVEEVQAILTSPEFLKEFNSEKGFLPFYAKGKSWSPKLFNKTLPSSSAAAKLTALEESWHDITSFNA